MAKKSVRGGQKSPKKQEPLSLAPLTAEEALKRMLGAPKETRPESMVPRGKPKSRKKPRE